MSSKLANAVKFFTGIGLTFAAAQATFAADGNPRVNQIGYIPAADKIATLRSDSSSPVAWELRQGNSVITSGMSLPLGHDNASGQSVHHIDFSNIELEGNNYRIVVGGDQSYPFDIRSDVYSALQYDAIKYFYHNRSGIEIETHHTGGGNGSYANDSKWSRPAGHLGAGVNKGDFGVPCFSGTCNYSLDVPYGWYDAGDHGKYVVNGGISVWKLASMYERAVHLGNNADAFADNTLNIPESGNGVADILDEIRWQMRFMLSMQVPQGESLAGMAHHKIHDDGWTGIPLPPHEDSTPRHLIPPSTAATLNLSATAAMCARLWRDIDPGFADQCLTAAQRAWDAAKANPSVILPDGTNHPYQRGGGAYGDKNLSDEFFWAAIELYITTGSPRYLSDIDMSSLSRTDYSWADTEVPALMSLATVPTDHTTSLMEQARQRLIDIANGRLATSNDEGYFTPIRNAEYVWGSNNIISNILTILGMAYDFTGNDEYAQGVANGLNYILGQNALSLSYITGHGEKAVEQPHHRFWANVKNGSFPEAPPGAFSGGPNTGLEDDLARGALDGCQSRPQTCFMDHIDSWSTNEITINWNSGIAWVLAFYDDYASDAGGNPIVEITSPANGDQFDAGENILVNASASDEDGNVTSVSFFVDGSFHSTDSSAPYSFTFSSMDERLYDIHAEAMDDEGKVATSESVTIRIGEVVNEPPTADFTVSTDGLSVSLDAGLSTDSDGTITQYQWDFGDGQTGTGRNVQHTYAEDGEYIITLTVTDDAGDSDDNMKTTPVSEPVNTVSCDVGTIDAWNNGAVIKDIVVRNIGSDAMAGWSVDIDTGVSNQVTDQWGAVSSLSSNGNIVTATGSDTLQPGESVSFGFIISFSNGFSNATCGGGTNPGNSDPAASFTSSTSGLAASFNASASSDPDGDSLSYEWNFGDGQTGTGVSPSHSYSEAGNYDVTLTVRDGRGGVDSQTSQVSVSDCQSDCGFDVTIQAEDYTAMQGIQTESTNDNGGGLNVGWIDPNDWMIYAPVNIPSSGSYVIEYRVASLNGGGRIQFEEGGGSPSYGQIDVPRTDGWQNWRTISHTVNLSAGNHNFAIAAKNGGFNVNWFRIRSAQ